MVNPLFEQAIKNIIKGETRFDALSKRIYSVDASIYQIEPIGIVIPQDTEDVVNTIQLAQQFNIPIIPRGAATGITGGCIGSGVIIDCTKFMNKIEEINEEEGYVICEPGLVQDVLNAALFPLGVRLGPDTSTGNRATIGGMIANNAAGSYSLRYGMMVDHIIEIEMVRSDGCIMHLGPKQPHHGPIYDTIEQVRLTYKQDIQENYKALPRRSSGYRLDTLIQNGKPNLAQLICGSEGTLGVITKAKLKICKKPKNQIMLLFFFHSIQEALIQVPSILQHTPLSIELIDRMILDQVKEKLDWVQGSPNAILIVEFDGNTPEMSLQCALECQAHIPVQSKLLKSPREMQSVWKVRKSGLELLQSKRSYRRAVAFIEDLSVPPEHLSDFMNEFLPILQSKSQLAGIYGHVGAGCIHIRPYIDMRNADEIEAMQEIANQSAKLIYRYHGAMSGEHGDGLVRSWALRALMGPRIMEAHQLIKNAFDPMHLMNPGKILTNETHLPLQKNLRLSPQTKHIPVQTFLDFSAEGGFSLAVDLCNGNGLCRKKTGLMCPSFQATQDEYDSTRARAEALKSVIIDGGKHLSDKNLQEVLDLCLECKGCKSECPSQIDMAKMKSEALYQMQEKEGYKWRHRLFGSAPWINRLLSKTPALSNTIGDSKPIKWLLNKIGITSKRRLPMVSKPLHGQLPQIQSFDEKVVLFSDTYSTHHCPEIGLCAIQIIQDFHVEPIIPQWECCGRTYFSKGMLRQAKNQAQRVVDLLYPHAKKGLFIIVLEPSCYSMLTDDYQGLLVLNEQWNEKWQIVKTQCLLFEEWLLLKKESIPKKYKEKEMDLVIHSHCHQKALKGENTIIELIKNFPKIKYKILETGCCGMAGSFGYEAEHYDLSMKIGALKLFPTILATDSKACANGFSCRHQIQDGTQRQSYHLAELLIPK